MNLQKLFEEIEKINGKYLVVLEDVCNIDSPTHFKAGVDAVGAYFINMAKERGWKIEVLKQEISGDVVCITLNSDAKLPPISLSGHIDTVHPVGSFGTPAVRRDDEKMYGPGVMDCKGGIVAAFMAMEALDVCGFKSRPVQLLLQSDEETGSAGSALATINYICDKAKDSVAFLNLEGSQGATAVLKRKGILRYNFTVRGKALHSSRCAEAASAIAEAAYKIIELEKMKDSNGLTCNCGVINGGTAANTVPEECTFSADIRFSTLDELRAVEQRISEIANNTTVDGCSCVVEEISRRPAMVMCDRNIKLLERMNEIYGEVGLPILTSRATPSGSDAAYTTEAGIPCVDNIGIEGGEIHSLREYVRLDSLVETAKRIAAVVYCI
ncbi:MAG: M20/M25/M40 family metallo-hydrolase [Clostridia bacterium]|nr:M20/M25/M40 family metallo-hydrolase [Clostridia bacterium]